jgi:hypothetical protein
MQGILLRSSEVAVKTFLDSWPVYTGTCWRMRSPSGRSSIAQAHHRDRDHYGRASAGQRPCVNPHFKLPLQFVDCLSDTISSSSVIM